MNLREAHHRRADALRRQRIGRLFRRYARNRGSGPIFFGCEAAWRSERGAGGDDQGTVRAGERGAEGLDGAPVYLAVRFEPEKSWMKAVWITPSEAAAPLRRLSRSSRSCPDALAPMAARDFAPTSMSKSEDLMARVD